MALAPAVGEVDPKRQNRENTHRHQDQEAGVPVIKLCYIPPERGGR